MRRLGFFLLVAAALLVALRLGTGIVYGDGEDVTYLVIKKRPGVAVERTATPIRPVHADRVVDSDEVGLVYGDAYLALMRAAPWLALGMAGAGLWLARSRPTKSGT